MPFWKCYYHVVWATKRREAAILPIYEPVIFAAITEKSTEFGCKVLATNAVADHVHIAVSIAPSLAVSKWVGSVKGVSARAINTQFERDARFQWQDGYGVMSLGEKALPSVLQYVASQKDRHATGDVNAYLERIENGD